MKRKELDRRIAAAYQLAGSLLIGCTMPKEARLEAEIVLLDFLSDPETADVKRLIYAAKAFRGIEVRSNTAVITAHSGSVTCNLAGCTTCGPNRSIA